MKKIINSLAVASIVAQGAVVNGHEVLGITLDKWWGLSDTLWAVLVAYLAVGVPITLVTRKALANGRLEASQGSVVGR